MNTYLVFRLYGPMASWGEIAVGESRHSAVYPSRSALLGLLGAALGVEREDDAGQMALVSGYRLAVKMISAGSPLRDYHTVQAPPQRRNTKYRTRRQELADGEQLNTLLSAREYRCDAMALVVVEAWNNALWPLEQMQKALLRPVFALYLGRKSCPLALPLDPQLIEAENAWMAASRTRQPSLASLLYSDQQHPWPAKSDRYLLRPSAPRFYWEEGMISGVQQSMQLMRNDQPLSRRRWQFAPRREWMALLPEERAQ